MDPSKLNKGDILICKKYHSQYNNENRIGRKYVIENIEQKGNKNIYVSADFIECKKRDYFVSLMGAKAVSSCFSSIKKPDNQLGI